MLQLCIGHVTGRSTTLTRCLILISVNHTSRRECAKSPTGIRHVQRFACNLGNDADFTGRRKMQSIKRSRARLAALALLASAALALSACSAGGGETSSATPANLDVVKIDLAGNVTSIDPTNNPYQGDNEIVALTSASLFQFKENSATETEPVLAASIAASSDLSTYTVTLKPNLTFSDGSPLTSTDVVASLTRLRDTAGPNQAD